MVKTNWTLTDHMVGYDTSCKSLYPCAFISLYDLLLSQRFCQTKTLFKYSSYKNTIKWQQNNVTGSPGWNILKLKKDPLNEYSISLGDRWTGSKRYPKRWQQGDLPCLKGKSETERWAEDMKVWRAGSLLLLYDLFS